MTFEINLIQEVDQKQFNYHVKNLHGEKINSIIPYKGKITIKGDLTEEEKTEIEVYYASLEGGLADLDYSQQQAKDQYIKNADTGKDYVFEISSKLLVMVYSGQVSIDQAEAYGNTCEKINKDLNQGYFHTAYLEHSSITPITEIVSLHEEIRIFIKNYINTNYSEIFHVV